MNRYGRGLGKLGIVAALVAGSSYAFAGDVQIVDPSPCPYCAGSTTPKQNEPLVGVSAVSAVLDLADDIAFDAKYDVIDRSDILERTSAPFFVRSFIQAFRQVERVAAFTGLAQAEDKSEQQNESNAEQEAFMAKQMELADELTLASGRTSDDTSKAGAIELAFVQETVAPEDTVEETVEIDFDLVIDRCLREKAPMVVELEEEGIFFLVQPSGGDEKVVVSLVAHREKLPANAQFLPAPITRTSAAMPIQEPARLQVDPTDCQFDPVLAAFQRECIRSCCGQTLAQQAKSWMQVFGFWGDDESTAGTASGTNAVMPAVVPARDDKSIREPRRLPILQQVSYEVAMEPIDSANRILAEGSLVLHSRHTPPSWATVASRHSSCHFQGASLEEVATYVHHVTGMTVRLELPADVKGVGSAGVHVLCCDQPVDRMLQVVLGSCGLAYMVRQDELTIASNEQIEEEVSGDPSTVDAYWYAR